MVERPKKLRWSYLWGGRTPSPAMVAAASVAGVLIAIPLLYILYRGAFNDPAQWAKLWNGRLPGLLGNTIALTFSVVVVAAVVGVSLAWLVERTDVAGRKSLRWILAMPLAVPSYVGALVYITIFGPRGLVDDQLVSWFGSGASGVLPEVFGFWGAGFILTLFTFPYIFLLTSAALRSMNASTEEAARSLGQTGFRMLRKVTLPLLRPAIAAGSLLVALHILADFGVVSMMRFDTFTSAIYTELTARFSRERAAMLSLALVILTLSILYAESRMRGRAKYYQTTGTWRRPSIRSLGKWKWAANIYISVILFLSLFLPLALLAVWGFQGLGEAGVGATLTAGAINSFVVSAGAATLAVIIAAPVAFLAIRYVGPISSNLYRLTQTGYSLPGVIVALSIIFIFINFIPSLYGTIVVLFVAYVILFIPESLQSTSSAISQISPNLEEASRSLGRGTFRTFKDVTLPLILPGVAAGWVLVFLSALKELPATLILRPIGFDTLPVHLWTEASEGFYTLAAPAGLLLVVVSAIPLYLLLTRTRAGIS